MNTLSMCAAKDKKEALCTYKKGSFYQADIQF